MAKFIDATVYVLVDGDGNYVSHEDNDQLVAAYDERVGNDMAEQTGFRRVKVTVKVPVPEMIEVTGEAVEVA